MFTLFLTLYQKACENPAKDLIIIPLQISFEKFSNFTCVLISKLFPIFVTFTIKIYRSTYVRTLKQHICSYNLLSL